MLYFTVVSSTKQTMTTKDQAIKDTDNTEYNKKIPKLILPVFNCIHQQLRNIEVFPMSLREKHFISRLQ